jgi:PrtD family type I secretion system ABC transporter
MTMPGIGSRSAGRMPPEIAAAVSKCRAAIIGAGIFSGLINLLALSSSIYMLQLYDRVIPAHSVMTLIGLSIVMLVLFAGYGLLDVIRTKLMSRIAIRIDRELRERVLGLVMKLPLRTGANIDASQPVRDLDQIRGFTASAGPVALFDMPWMPFYLALVWMLHPWLGMLATGGALLLVGLTFLTELRGREPTRDMTQSGAQRQQLIEAAKRNAPAIHAMGMNRRITRMWSDLNERFLADQTAATDVIGTYGAISRVLRLVLQSAVLGLGAYLVIIGQGTAGVMIAASILVSRALAPVEIAIANWRGFMSARQSSARLGELFRMQPERIEPTPLPKPTELLQVEGVWAAPPGSQQPVVQNVSFQIKKGAGLGVIGPSAAGKSTLVRSVIGAWPLMRGTVRLDGASLDQWDSDALGQHIGYLPQEIELLDGTVAENIARFEPDAAPEQVIAAARAAGVHDMILRLPNGYDTRLGEGGAALSAGQRQRVALARALYRDPFLVVLDEPNSNLDKDGDDALERAIVSVRTRGGIVIVVAHRPSALGQVDHILLLSPGQPPIFGPKEEVYRKMTQAAPGAPVPPGPAAPGARPMAPQQAMQAGQAQQPAPVLQNVLQGDSGARLRIITDGS